MTTIINHTLYFSRENAHPFMHISTVVKNKAGKTVHSHCATVEGEYPWELRDLWARWQEFKAEEADMTMVNSGTTTLSRYISVTKVWEG